MITKTIKISELDYGQDIIDGLGCGKLKNGDCEPVIVDVQNDGSYSLADGYHRLAGMIAAGEEEITIGILEESDWKAHREEFKEEFEEGDIIDEYEHLVDLLSNNL